MKIFEISNSEHEGDFNLRLHHDENSSQSMDVTEAELIGLKIMLDEKFITHESETATKLKNGQTSTNTPKYKIKPCENDNCPAYSNDFPSNCCYIIDCNDRV